MLLLTDDKLFNLISGKLLYQPSPLALAYTPTTAVDVVRYGASEYVALLRNGEKPFISVQYMQTSNDPPLPMGFGLAMQRAVDSLQMRSVAYPQPKSVQYQLDIRSPHDIWLRQIEQELNRLFVFPIYRTTITVSPWGTGNGTLAMPVIFYFGDAVRTPDTQDPKQNRFFRLTWRVEAWTWLLASSSGAEILPRYTHAEVTYKDLTTDAVLEVQTET